MTAESSGPLARAAAGEAYLAGTDEQPLERFRFWLENSRDVIIETNRDGRIVDASSNVKRVLGYATADLVGTNVFDYVHPGDLAAVRRQFAEPEGWVTYRCRHRDGSWRWMEASGKDFAVAPSERRFRLIARDVTGPKWAEDERQNLETQLRQAQKLETLATLAGGVVHDFNNVLATIISSVEVARIKTEGQPDVQRCLNQVLIASNRAKNLVRQILRFSRDEKHEREPIKLPAIVSEVFKLLRPTLPATIDLRTDVRDSSSVVLADPTQVHQMLMNLCLNSAQAMNAGAGRIDVRLDSLFIDEVCVRAQPTLQAGAYVRLTVADTGSGMDPETLKRIFDPFFTTKGDRGGTGLGLAVVRRIIEEHRGAMHVSSQPGEGTVFELFFPRHQSATVHVESDGPGH